MRQEIQTLGEHIQTIAADKKRLRNNMRELANKSKLFEKYLKALEVEEKDMDDLQMKLKTLHADETAARNAYDDYSANLSAE